MTWKKIDDGKVRHRWVHPDFSEPKCEGPKGVYVSPSFYADAGTPVCEECGEDMEYAGTEIQEDLVEEAREIIGLLCELFAEGWSKVDKDDVLPDGRSLGKAVTDWMKKEKKT